MASKEYAYFMKGNKIAIVERDVTDSSGLTSPSSVPDIELSNSRGRWKSPLSDVLGGLRIEYTTAADYFLADEVHYIATSTHGEGITRNAAGQACVFKYTENADGNSREETDPTTYNWYDTGIVSGDTILIKGTSEVNGLHTVAATSADNNTNSILALTTTFDSIYNQSAGTHYQASNFALKLGSDTFTGDYTSGDATVTVVGPASPQIYPGMVLTGSDSGYIPKGAYVLSVTGTPGTNVTEFEMSAVADASNATLLTFGGSTTYTSNPILLAPSGSDLSKFPANILSYVCISGFTGGGNGVYNVKESSATQLTLGQVSPGEVILATDQPSSGATIDVATAFPANQIEVYADVVAITDESSTIGLPDYLGKALTYYVKAQLAEDQMDIDAKEYFLREFRLMLERYESARVWGPRLIGPGPSAIR